MSIQKTILPIDLHTWLTEWISTHRRGSIPTIELLAGDGSTRKFYRVQLSGTQPLILLSDPDWTLSQDYTPHQAFLESRELPVPKFLAQEPKVGALLMEDLGDGHLQHAILEEQGKKLDYSRRAMELLSDLHGKTYPVPASLPCFKRYFDQEKYFQELEFTWSHLVDGYLGQGVMNAAQKKSVESFCAKIAKIGPMVFCHRDYHSRNILLNKKGLYLIDFQDARLGCPHYDAASFLYDAYIPLTDEEREDLLATYKTAMGPYALSKKIHWENFTLDLRAVAFQRVLKAAGSFASFWTRYGRDSHLQYIRPALNLALQLQSQLGGAFLEWPVKEWMLALEEKEKSSHAKNKKNG